MHIKEIKKIYKRIIEIAVFVLIIMVAAFTIILFNLLRKPQVKVARAFAAAIRTSEKSGINRMYGTQELARNMITGSQYLLYHDESDNGVTMTVKRNMSDQEFLFDIGYSDKNFKLYGNNETSIIYKDGMAVNINYTGDLAEKMRNSPVISMLGLENDTINDVCDTYLCIMKMATGSYKEDSELSDKDIIKNTVKYFLSMEGKNLGTKMVSIGGKNQKCKVYSVEFDTWEFNNYLDECFGTHGIDIDALCDRFNNLRPGINSIDNDTNMVHYISQFVDNVLDGSNITFYFAVNKDNELVKMYSDDVSDNNIFISLTFEGDMYIAEVYEINITAGNGRSFTFRKEDADNKDGVGTEYEIEYKKEETAPNINAKIKVFFTGESADFTVQSGNFVIKKKADISSFEKGKSIDIEWGGENPGNIHIGCDPGSIEIPQYTDSIDLLNTDVISAYTFVKKLIKK